MQALIDESYNKSMGYPTVPVEHARIGCARFSFTQAVNKNLHVRLAKTCHAYNQTHLEVKRPGVKRKASNDLKANSLNSMRGKLQAYGA